MNEIRRKGKAEGSVLFTVVSVMMVMVVFLMSTLILTTSANRRSYYTYYENQAQYTAQGVLDAISNYAFNDDSFYKWVKALPATGGEVAVDVENTHIPLTPGSEVRAFVEPVDDNYIWDQETGSIRCQNGWKITVTASVGRGKNASESTTVNYIFENFQDEVASATQNTAGWLVAPTLNYSSHGGHGSSGGTSSNQAKAMFTGSGSSFFSGNNLLCLGPQTFGITHFPKGNGFYNEGGTNEFANNSTTVGDGVFVGNFKTNDKIAFDFQGKGEGVQFYGDFSVTNKATFESDMDVLTNEYRYLSYIYCDGNLNFNENTEAKIGGDSGKNGSGQPVNVYTNQITNAPYYMMGDMYIFDPNKNSTLHSNKETTLARFIGDNVKKTNSEGVGYVGGDIICNSKKLTIDKKLNIGGDLILTNPEGELVIENVSDPGEIGGAIVCAGKLTISDGNKKGLNVAGGIYVDPSKAVISSTINGVAVSIKQDTPLADKIQVLTDICNKSTDDAYHTTPYHDASLARIDNSATSAHIESLGGKGYTCGEGEGYADLVSHLLNDELGNSRYVLNAAGVKESVPYYNADYNGIKYGLFPFCSRQDEIFTQYLRWDLARASEADAQAIIDNGTDALIVESQAAGHVWGVQTKYSDDGTTYVPYTTPINVKELNHVKEQEQNENCFIPPLDTQTSQPKNLNYYSDATKFKEQNGINATNYKKIGDLTASKVTIISRPAGGCDESGAKIALQNPHKDSEGRFEMIDTIPVITDSCELDITADAPPNDPANPNKLIDYFVFIDPTKQALSGKPLAIYLSGEYKNGPLTLIVNNSGYYSGGVYSDVTSYAEKSHAETNPMYAGRSDVLIFLDKNISANKYFKIITTGAYKQIADQEYDVISNPVYPAVMQEDGSLALSATWDDMYIKRDPDAYKFEMIPNVVVYGEGGHDYSRTDEWGNEHSQLQNGATFNAEVLMPDSKFGSPSGDAECYAKSVKYREFPSAIAYDYNSADKLIISLGTLYVQDMNVKNVPLCVYLGDLGRPGTPDTPGLTLIGTGNNGSQSGNIMAGNNNDKFGKNYQGAS